MSNKKTESALDRLKREREEAAQRKAEEKTDLVDQLTHESDGEPDYAAIAEKLKQRQADNATTSPDYVKFTIYIDRPVAEAFKALCTQNGDQRRFATAAFADFVKKMARELDID